MESLIERGCVNVPDSEDLMSVKVRERRKSCIFLVLIFKSVQILDNLNFNFVSVVSFFNFFDDLQL